MLVLELLLMISGCAVQKPSSEEVLFKFDPCDNLVWSQDSINFNSHTCKVE